MLNELGAIEACLDAFALQDFPLDRLEVMVIDGGSTDGSRRYVDERSKTDPWIRVVDNPVGSAAAAFNIGARQGTGDIVFLFSSHGVPASDYVSRSVKVLLETGATGVGGRYLHIGTDAASSAIGGAMVSRFGMASSHRFSDRARAVDTISHPAYVREALVAIGGFDESLGRNSDYEINIRLRGAGHLLWFDPSIESIYRPRPDLPSLARQFWHYGKWKATVARQHPGGIRPRHLAAPAFVAGVALSPLLALSPIGRVAVAAIGSVYAAGCSAAATEIVRSSDRNVSIPTAIAAFPTMHLSWGSGFLLSPVVNRKRTRP